MAFALLSARMRAFWDRVKQGFTILRDRRRYLREVFAVQFAGWVFRFAAFWMLLEAFRVGGSVRNVLLVLGVNAVAAAVPFTPQGAGVAQALLVKVFAGTAATSTVAAYSVGQQIAIGVLTFGIGFAALAFIFRVRSFKEAIRRAGGARRAARQRRLAGELGPEALARLAHEDHGLREHHAHGLEQVARLLLGVALEVQPGDSRDRHVHGQLDCVVGPGDLLGALHLLRELRHAPAQLVRVAEEAAEWVF